MLEAKSDAQEMKEQSRIPAEMIDKVSDKVNAKPDHVSDRKSESKGGLPTQLGKRSKAKD